MDIRSFTVFLSFQESFVPTTIWHQSRSSGGVFPLNSCLGGFRYLNFEYVHLQHRRIHDYDDVKFFNLRKEFQTQIWDPGGPIYSIAKGGIRLRTDHIHRHCLMFVSAIEISNHHPTTSTISCICGEVLFFPLSVSFGLRDLLLDFVIRIHLGFDDEPVSLSQLSKEEMDLVIQKSLWLSVVWMITIYLRFSNIQDKVLWLIPLLLQEWRINVEYLHDHIIDIIEKANQTIEDYRFVSTFNQHDFTTKQLRYKKATSARNMRNLCAMLDLVSNMYWLHWKQSKWQQPWERNQQIYHDVHRDSLWEPSNILIVMRRQVPETFLATFSFIVLINVMPSAFWSFSYMLLANKKCVKEGHNRYNLLAYKSKDSMVTLHSFIEIVIISCICVIGCLELFLYLVNTF